MVDVETFFMDLDSLEGPEKATGRFQTLEEEVAGLSVTTAWGQTLFQSEGVLAGVPYYFIYRNGRARLTVGVDPVGTPLYAATALYTSEGGGNLSDEEFQELMKVLATHLKKAPFRYAFAGKRVAVIGSPTSYEFVELEERQLHQAWGHSPEDAYQQLKKVSEPLLSRGFTKEIQAELFQAQQIDKTPLNEDVREFSLLPESLNSAE